MCGWCAASVTMATRCCSVVRLGAAGRLEGEVATRAEEADARVVAGPVGMVAVAECRRAGLVILVLFVRIISVLWSAEAFWCGLSAAAESRFSPS